MGCTGTLMAAGFCLLLGFSPLSAAQEEGSSCELAFVAGKPDKAGIAAIRQAAEANDAQAQYRLGCLYRYGWGVEVDPQQALSWLGRASGQRHSLARREFFDLQTWGEAQALEAKAQKLLALRRQGEAGNADVQFKLGMMYRDGLGVQRDYPESVKWLTLASEQGLADAQFRLGMMYYRGHGVAKDSGQARIWLKRAADQEHDRALLVLGSMYETGDGVEIDKARAKDFYGRSAARGNGKAREQLERMERGK